MNGGGGALELRPLVPEDAAAAGAVARRAFGDPPAGAEEEAWKAAALAYLIGTDPAGSWGAERDGALAGVAVAIVREGLCGVSLLVVEPAAQGRGTGRALLARALEHGAGARTALVASSDDPRALRAYVRAGFRLHPCLEAHGRVDRARLPDGGGVREGRPEDLDLARALDREQRGAARGGELEHALAYGRFRMLVAPDRGYAVVRPGALVILAARDLDAARALLATALADAGGEEVTIPRLTGEQAWAVELAVAARLELRRGGALGVRGAPGPLCPYVAGGLWL